MKPMGEVRCILCNKLPEEIWEYIDAARREKMTPTQYVVFEEGTYNHYVKGKFFCTECYIKAGQPLRPRGW